MVIFICFVIGALLTNWQHFVNYIGLAFVIVLIINSVGLFTGYSLPRLFKLSHRDAKACSFEVGIQNAGFCLMLIFSFFDGLGGMALIAAWWGIWHIISGLTLATIWKKKSLNIVEQNYAKTI
jgi:BASS family bile acid:Na+ symporter